MLYIYCYPPIPDRRVVPYYIMSSAKVLGSFPSHSSQTAKRATVDPAVMQQARNPPAPAGPLDSSSEKGKAPSLSPAELSRLNMINNTWSVYTFSKEISPDGIQKLTRSDNYHRWRDLMRLLLQNLYLWECLTGTMDIKPTDGLDIVGKLTLLQARCFTYLLQSIDPTLHHFIVTHQTPHAIWQALENQYDRQNDMNIHK